MEEILAKRALIAGFVLYVPDIFLSDTYGVRQREMTMLAEIIENAARLTLFIALKTVPACGVALIITIVVQRFVVHYYPAQLC